MPRGAHAARPRRRERRGLPRDRPPRAARRARRPADGAHHAVPVGAYLDAAQLIAACAASGADALHPGYGFLSENAGFAEACARAGLVFIGPSPEAIRRVGDKLSARALAAQVGVPVSPGATATPPDGGRGAPRGVGFPLLIKAAAGGGGKGMRIVARPRRARRAGRARARRGRALLGDPRVYAEPLVERPRHLEVQVLGDGRGGVEHRSARATARCSAATRS